MKSLLLLAVLMTATAQARSLLEHPHFEMEPGRKIYVEMQRAHSAAKPTFLFLPGLYCAPLLDEKFIENLRNAGFGTIIMNFSLQGPSINLLDKDEVPLFKKRNMTLEDLAHEVEFVAEMVRAEFPGIKIIPVSLSYSSIVSPYLKGFPHIIETSPMTSTWSAVPSIRNLRSFLNFNPFLSKNAVRKLMDQTYFNTSWGITEFTIQRYKLSRERKFEMNEGYETLMRMAEDFDWADVTPDSKIQRDWILAGNEEFSLKVHQLRTIKRLKQMTGNIRVAEIPHAGHIIKDFQPAKFAQALEQFAGGCEDHVTL